MSSEAGPGRPTMSMAEAAAYVGRHEETVRRWIDAAEDAGQPVAERERDERGRPVKGSWRRPYVDAVQEWKRRLQGGAFVANDGGEHRWESAGPADSPQE